MHTLLLGTSGSRFLIFTLLFTAAVCRLGLAQQHPPGHGPVTNPATSPLSAANNADQAVDRAIQELRNFADCVKVGFPELSEHLSNTADTLARKVTNDEVRLFFPPNADGGAEGTEDVINHEYAFTPGNSQNNTGQGPTYHYNEEDDSNLILLANDDFENGQYRGPPHVGSANPPQQQTGDVYLSSQLYHEYAH